MGEADTMESNDIRERLMCFFQAAMFLALYAVMGCMIILNVTRGSSGSQLYVQKQLVSMVLCLVVSFVLFMLPLESLKKLFLPGTIVAYIMLWGLFVFGRRINGSRGWYRFGTYSLQPAEIVKPLFIIALALVCEKVRGRSAGVRLAWLLLFAGAVQLPIALQPDWGTVLVYSVTFAAVIWCEGLPRKHLLVLAVLALGAGGLAVGMFRHVRLRFTGFFESLFTSGAPSGYHAQRLQECLVKGGWTGSMFQRQDALNALPYRYSDSLFAGATELLGAMGVIPIVLLCMAWCVYCFQLAAQQKRTVPRCVYMGSGAMVSVQAFIHLAVNLGLMPNTGIPLPLFSYGGSSMLATFVIVTMVQRLKLEKEESNRSRLSTKT